MAETFLSSYLEEVTASLSNWHGDNHDFYRFGPAPKRSLRTLLSEGRQRWGCRRAASCSREVMAAVRLVEEPLAHFAWLYDRLADDASRETLVKVLAFRALGQRRVKLPLNTPAYWEALRQMEGLADPGDAIPLSFQQWRLPRLDLNAVGIPVRLYLTPMGAHHQFVLEQYRYRGRDGEIAVDPGDWVIDAGGCWGDTALYFAARSGPDGQVFSYEFVPENLAILRRNLALNPGLGERIRVIERAAWEESDLTLSLESEGPASRVAAGGDAPGNGPLTLAIDDLVGRQNLPRVDFIKMDIEGAELSALRGAAQTIRRHRPKLAISVYHRLADFFEIPRYLESLGCGYRYFLQHSTIHAEETVLFARRPS